MKKEKQLTAVQWLVNQLETGFNYNILEEDGYKKQRKIIFQEALELEHAQHQLLKMKNYSESNTLLQAQLLINRFKDNANIDYENAVDCAIIYLDSLLESNYLSYPEDRLYWRSVKKGCEKLR